jgi:diacylglycerol kinase family enzyme
MISAGFDAEVVRVLHENRRGNINRTAYLWPTLQTLRSYRFPQLEVTWDAGQSANSPRHCRWLFGFNLPLYALGLRITPEAVATDGQLDLCLFERGNIWSPLRYLWHVRRGGHLALDDVQVQRSSNFRLAGPNSQPVAYQIDGDFGGTLPVDVEVMPGELRLLVSTDTARSLGFVVS